MQQDTHTKSTGNIDAITLSKQLLTDAIINNASDIHIEPFKKNCRIRMRIDGVLHNITTLLPPISAPLISRFKILANLDIAEKRLPQDGRFYFSTEKAQKRDCRISSCPTQHGEKLVIRLLQTHNDIRKLRQLGMSTASLKHLKHAIKKPQGLILVTGPTGSGKSTTLYAALNELNKTTINISSVEDPVEIEIEGINQIAINSKIGLTFPKVLRTLLRQDPDVLMVGEVRDKETAEIAIQAAHTGHLVLATLHANNAASAITRLTNMGIAPYNIRSTLTLVLAQRLLRRKCSHCKENLSCTHCRDGYHGRIGVYEFLDYQHKLNVDTTLWDDAQAKIKQKLTTFEEAYRILGARHE